MLLTKKDFRENLKYVKDKKGEVIDSMTEKCSLNTQYAQVYAEALFEEIREVFYNFPSEINHTRQL